MFKSSHSSRHLFIIHTFFQKRTVRTISAKDEVNRITELGFNFLNKIIVSFVDSLLQKSIFGLFCQYLYSYQNKGPRGARVQNHSTVTHDYLNNIQKAMLLGLG